jgi:aryl-alcohol dehydrogenase-like predicted oxidoreductase
VNLRKLGSTSLDVSPIGLGLAALGRPGYINLGHGLDLEEEYGIASMRARAHRMLNAAYRGGVRYFDAARSYGRAEEFLGGWLRMRGFTPDDVIVASKWGYIYTANWQVEAERHEIKEHTHEVFLRQWDESRTHLGVYLDLYQIHSATIESGVLQNVTVLGELARLKSAGVAIGLTVSGPQQEQTIERVMEATIDGELLFDSVQATWNLLEKSAGRALQSAREAGMGVIIKEALANGRLTEKNTAPEFTDKLKAINEQAARMNTTLDALALAAVLAQPWVDVVLSGAARIQHLQSNLRAVVVKWDEEVEARLGKLVEAPEDYWQTRSNLAWN